MAEPTILILGAGTFGVSTAYHLSKTYKDPSRVTIIDRQSSPPSAAAAIDINRIIRTDYVSPVYCDMAYEALHDWFWMPELGPHFHKVGWLMLDEKGSGLAAQIRQTLSDRGSHMHENVDLDDLKARWSFLEGSKMEEFESAYFNPDAGWCDAAAATKSLMEAAEARGVKRVTAEVSELLYEPDRGLTGVLCSDGRRLSADSTVLAAGAWTSSLLSPVEDRLDMPEADRVERQIKATGAVAAYYRVSEEEAAYLTDVDMPVIVYGHAGEVVPPTAGYRLMKWSNSMDTVTNAVTTASGQRITSPPRGKGQRDVPQGLQERTSDRMISKVMPSLTGGKRPDYWRICWDALTPTEDWLMCQHPNPKLRDLYLTTGGSFHSYKFLPVAGKYVLKMLNGESNGEDKDRTWGWKSNPEWTVQDRSRSYLPATELSHWESPSQPRSRL